MEQIYINFNNVLAVKVHGRYTVKCLDIKLAHRKGDIYTKFSLLKGKQTYTYKQNLYCYTYSIDNDLYTWSELVDNIKKYTGCSQVDFEQDQDGELYELPYISFIMIDNKKPEIHFDTEDEMLKYLKSFEEIFEKLHIRMI